MAKFIFLCFSVLATVGCANLEARKVPLQDRLAGADGGIHGFRYYLSRPYVVVSERVCVGQRLSIGKLVHSKESNEVYLKTMDEVGGSLYFNARGEIVVQGKQPADLVSLTVEVPVTKPAPAGGGDPPMESPGEGTGMLPSPTPPGSQTPTPEASPQDHTMTPAVVDSRSQADPQFSITSLTKQELQGLLASKNCPSPNAFQFVMLPDFEEQMAVKDRNIAAYGKYEMHFADGWQLTSVSGSWDSTQVAVKALQVLGKAVTAAADVRKEQLDKLPQSKGDYGDVARADGKAEVWGARVESLYIEPGIYRVQKISEQTADGPFLGENGLLSQLGFDAVADVQLVAIKVE